jgi:anti-sigma factor RsiW
MSERAPITDEELLAAYCDGVTELSLEERKRVEALLARAETARTNEAATRSMIGALRDLPAEGTEPDWTAMERAIRAQVPDDVPRQWWRPVWRWLVPVTAVATMATIALLAFGDREREGERAEPVREPIAVVVDAGVESPVPAPAEHVAVHLDGEDIMLEATDDELLDVDDMLLGEGDMDVPGLLSSDDLAWIDDLDDDAAAFAEQWLDERKKG